jgi:hypothetical protein
LGSFAASATRIPVFHVHGYVHHPSYPTDERPPSVDRLVITLEDYEHVWKRKDVFGTTMGPQIHYLRYFTALFIGFSFTDKYVCNLLKQVNRDYLQHTNRTHFALLPNYEIQAKGQNFFEEIGVSPIGYSNHSEIPDLLEKIYESGLIADQILSGKSENSDIIIPEVLVRTHLPTTRSYGYPSKAIFQLAQHLRNENASASLVNKLGECLNKNDSDTLQ